MQQQQQGTRTVYVGNLNFKTTSEDLENFFEGAEIGNVVNVDLKRHPGQAGDNNQSKGWALVDFASSIDAQSCAEQLNGALLDERILTIRLDRKSVSNPTMNGGRSSSNNGGQKVQVSFPPSDRLFVGNLPWSANNSVLFDLFQSYNPTSATVVFGRDGRSRGYGIVEFDSVNEATVASEAVNGMEYSGRMLNVRYDASQKPPSAQQKAGGEGGFNRSYDDTVYVGNLPWGITWQQLKDLFQEFSPEYADVKQGPDGRSRGWGTVRFANAEITTEAITKFNGYELIGRTGPRNIEVRQDRGPTAKE
jgi:RNA recognition motif-containing protein